MLHDTGLVLPDLGDDARVVNLSIDIRVIDSVLNNRERLSKRTTS